MVGEPKLILAHPRSVEDIRTPKCNFLSTQFNIDPHRQRQRQELMTFSEDRIVPLHLAHSAAGMPTLHLIAGLIVILCLNLCWADPLVTFDFSHDLNPTQKAVGISMVTPLGAALSVARQDGFTESARANSWNLTGNTNYYRLSFAIDAGYVVDLDSVQFDFMSQQTVSTTNGPTRYNVKVGVNGGAFVSLSGGWQTMSANGVWHRGVVATHNGVALSNLTGYVTITLAAQGARGEKSRWYVDNLAVNGHIRPKARSLLQPRITALPPNRTLWFSPVAADQYYSVQYTTNLGSPWKLFPGAANLTPRGDALLADLTGLTDSTVFLRGVTSVEPLTTVTPGGFWKVTSANSPFSNAILWFDQDGSAISFEQSLLGVITDNSFTIAENGAEWISGTVTGDTLSFNYALPLAGLASTGVCQAVRYTGPMYEVWQGTNVLTESQYYNPGANGYTRIGQDSATATFAASEPYLVICANTLTPIDAIVGSEQAFLDPAIVTSISIGNALYSDQLYGLPDGQSAWIGSGQSSNGYRGFAAFGPVSYNSVTVTIGLPQIPPVESSQPYSANLLAQTFFLEYDSDGTSPLAEAEVALMFEPNGVAQMYASVPDYAISYRGSYSYSNGQLSLKFSDQDFNPSVKFPLDLTSSSITMPFDVFTQGTKGPSRWRRENADLAHNLWIVFHSATANEQLSIDEGLGRALNYAQALVQTEVKLDASPGPILIATSKLENGIRLTYRMPNKKIVSGDVLLFGRNPPGDSVPFTESVLFYDPRVHLEVKKGTTSGQDDPAKKTALLISPFFTRRTYSHDPTQPAGSFEEDQALMQFSENDETLQHRGYPTPAWLIDGDVSVKKLIRELTSSPGVVYFSSHGQSDGLLSTGTYLGTDKRHDDVLKRFEFFKDQLREQGYGDLLDYQIDGRNALEIIWIHNGADQQNSIGMIGVSPVFWSWLNTKGANFSSSLVFIGACFTSKAPALRHAIRAKALFSFDAEVPGLNIAGVGRYLVESLARRSHSAEETYYNIRRVFQTRQLIYTQDGFLTKVSPTVVDHLHGYVTLGPGHNDGPQGIMDYTTCGWLQTATAGKIRAGNVWWLLFASRWGQDAQGGTAGILRCWNTFWYPSKPPPIGDSCINCNPGTTPNQDEVAYALYLLTGKAELPFSGITAPRWTLNDGGP